MSWLVALLVACVVWCLVPAAVRVGRLDPRPVRRTPRWLGAVVWALLALTSVIAAAAVVGADLALWLTAAGVAGGLGLWLVRRQRERRERQRTQLQVAEACQVMAGQLAIGQIPAMALAAAAEDCPVVRPVAAAQAVGSSVPDALRQAAGRPGAEGLSSLAAAWELSVALGAPAAAMASAVAEGLAEEHKLRQTVATELSATRATGRILAGLPVVGVGMAALIGADPATFLLQTWPGRGCVLAAVVLTTAGVVWSEKLTDRAARAA